MLDHHRRILAVGLALPALTAPAIADEPASTPAPETKPETKPDTTVAPPLPVSLPPPPVEPLPRLAPPPMKPPLLEADARSFGMVLGFSGATLGSPIPAVAEPAYYGRSSNLGLHSRWSPSIGLQWQRPMKGKWAFLPEVWYHQFGTRLAGMNNLVYDTFSVPLMYRKYDRNHRPVTPFVELGPEFSFALSTRTFNSLIPYGATYVGQSYSSGPLRWLMQFDVGLRAGLGASFPLANARGTVGIRVFHGVVPRVIGDGVLFNRQISFTAGLAFGRPRK